MNRRRYKRFGIADEFSPRNLLLWLYQCFAWYAGMLVEGDD
jgi:hypothetical protein